MDRALEDMLRMNSWRFVPGPPVPGLISPEAAQARLQNPPAGTAITTESGSFWDKRVKHFGSKNAEPLYRNHMVWIVSAVTDSASEARHLIVEARSGRRIMELIVGWRGDPRSQWQLLDPLEPPEMSIDEAMVLFRSGGRSGVDVGLPVTAEYGGWRRSAANGAQILDVWKITVDTSSLNREIGTEGPNRVMPLEAASVTILDDKAACHMLSTTILQEDSNGNWLYPHAAR